jgi:glycosyltransferase involved in cell wall biosynthesis
MELVKNNTKINYNHYKKYLKQDILESNVDLKPKTDKPVFLTFAHYGYPPFGGGENWLIDVMTFMNTLNYECVMICFYDSISHTFFEKLNIIYENNLTFIQHPKDDLMLIKRIKSLNPVCCHHQGLRRIEFMNLFNILNIPFITGFCFWNDIFNTGKDYKNINILENIENGNIVKTKNFKIISQNSITYCASDFVLKVIQSLYNKNIPVIESVTNEEHFKIKYSQQSKYITIINIHYYKGGWLLFKILELDYPFLLIDTEKNKKEFNVKLQNIIDERIKNKFVHKIVWIKKKIDIKTIYKKTKILLIPSIVDESFCKIAFEGMKNKIPILSSTSGNLRCLLDGYADFLNHTPEEWAIKLQKIYFDEEYLTSMSSRVGSYELQNDMVFNKFYDLVKSTNKNLKNKYIHKKNIGLCVPWADQGLGIQGREYYMELVKQGYKVHIMSFKPYNSNKENKYFQTNPEEWNYENIHYYDNIRENINLNDITDFITKTNVSTMIFIELCYGNIFKIAEIFKIFRIKIIGIPNIETTRYSEIKNHEIFDSILCNNYQTFNILNLYGFKNCHYLGFSINNPVMSLKEVPLKKEKITFFCIGGLNAIKRKHIDKICDVFNDITIKNIELIVNIQGVDYIKTNYNNVKIITKNCDYKEISEIYKKHDIFIHFGGQEGLGLGFYESLKCGTPVLTLDCPPNNEIIQHDITGWLVKTTKHKIKYNSESVIMEDIFDREDFIKILHHIINTYDCEKIYKNIKNIKHIQYIDTFIKHLE